jgi:hypothetical protein
MSTLMSASKTCLQARAASRASVKFVALVGVMTVGSMVSGAVTLAQADSAGGAARKAAMLAMGISEMLNNFAFAFCVALIGALWLGVCSLVWRGR